MTKALELNNGSLEIFYETLIDISGVKLPIKMSNIILETIGIVEPKLKVLAERREAIIIKFCKKGENGKPEFFQPKDGDERQYTFESDDVKNECSEEIKRLMNDKVDLVVREIAPEEIADLENVKPSILITPAQTDLLWAFTNKK